MLIDEDDIACDWLEEVSCEEPVAWWKFLLIAWLSFT